MQFSKFNLKIVVVIPLSLGMEIMFTLKFFNYSLSLIALLSGLVSTTCQPGQKLCYNQVKVFTLISSDW